MSVQGIAEPRPEWNKLDYLKWAQLRSMGEIEYRSWFPDYPWDAGEAEYRSWL